MMVDNNEKGESAHRCPEEAVFQAPQLEPITVDPGHTDLPECECEEGDAVAPGDPSTGPHPGGIEAPDGGWGWVVLFATIMVLALTLAFPSCVSIFYTDLQTEFHASNSETSWVPSIMTSVLHAGGVVYRSFCRAYLEILLLLLLILMFRMCVFTHFAFLLQTVETIIQRL